MAKNNSYLPGDKVVVRTIDWEGNQKLQVALITHVRYATSMTKKSYDMRTESGGSLIYTGVDEAKSNQTIVSSITKAWLANGGENNMYIDKRNGHTRGNYSKNIRLRADGEDMKSNNSPIGHFEKHNNFTFPAQGARSF